MAAALYLSKLNVNGQEYEIKDANAARGTALQDLADNLADGLASKVGYAEYDSENQSIHFYDIQDKRNRTERFKIDATDFIKDGMVSKVEIVNGNLVITFNTDADKERITIPLTDIFNPANYYDKTAMDAALALKADASNVYTKSEADGKFLTEHQSLANYPTIETMNTALGQKANVSDIYTQTEIDNKLAAKADASNVYTKAEVDTQSETTAQALSNINTQLAAKANSADLATVATSGSYNDLSDKPVIPEGAVVDAALSDTSENPVQNKVVKGALDAKQNALQYYSENTENKSANIHIEHTDELEESSTVDLDVNGYGVIINSKQTQQDVQEGTTIVNEAGISSNNGSATMYYQQSVDDETTTYSNLDVGQNIIGLSVESDVEPMPYSHLNVRQNDISLEVKSDEDHITTFEVNDTGATINDERVLTEPDLNGYYTKLQADARWPYNTYVSVDGETLVITSSLLK